MIILMSVAANILTAVLLNFLNILQIAGEAAALIPCTRPTKGFLFLEN
jgi:hypothetical protein